jgi:hypothetical protein
MNKLHLTLLLGAFAMANSFAQALQYRNFDFKDKAPVVNCTPEELKNNKAIILYEHRAKELVVTPNKDLENNLFYYRAVLINDVSVIDKFNKVYIPVQSSAELITLKCRVTMADGKTVELYKGDMKSVEEEGKMYNILALEGLDKNAIIEYYYIKRIGLAYTMAEYISSRFLVKNYKFEIIAPDVLIYEAKGYNGMGQPEDTTLNEKNFLTVTLKDIQPVPEEKYATNYGHLPRLEGRLSYNANNHNKKLYTYSDFSKQITKNYHELEKNDEKVVNKMYKKLELEDKKTTDEKVFAIESFIKNETGFIEDAGDLSMGDCLDKKGLSKFYQNKLATLLLDKCKINYELVSTTDISEKTFDPEFESYNYLDEVLFHITETKKYLSFESLLYRYGLESPYVCGQKGLFIKPLLIGEAYSATYSIKDVACSDPTQNYDHSVTEITFKPVANKVSMSITRTLQGYAAATPRAYYYYNGDTKREEYLKELLSNGLENTKVSLVTAQNFELDNFRKYDQPFIASGIVETGNLSEVAGNDIIFKIGACIGPQDELYQEGKRMSRIYTINPHTYKRTISFTIPQGYVVQGLEKLNMSVELKDGAEVTAFFKSTYTKEGDKITIVIDESYKRTFYDVKDFDGFRAVVNAAADFNKLSLLLKKQ